MAFVASPGIPCSPNSLPPWPHLPKVTPAQHCQEFEILEGQG